MDQFKELVFACKMLFSYAQQEYFDFFFYNVIKHFMGTI